jgi:hypothetical protein
MPNRKYLGAKWVLLIAALLVVGLLGLAVISGYHPQLAR